VVRCALIGNPSGQRQSVATTTNTHARAQAHDAVIAYESIQIHGSDWY
jgi:hypothetical protein